MNQPLTAIEKIIDEQTGHGKAKIIEWQKGAISLMECIIENKKIIEADTTNDEQVLSALKNKLGILKSKKHNHE